MASCAKITKLDGSHTKVIKQDDVFSALYAYWIPNFVEGILYNRSSQSVSVSVSY